MNKQYIKDGIIYDSLNSVVINNMEIINPREDQILEAGYTEYSKEYTLDELKLQKYAEIDEYDTSDNVNIFYYNTFPFWLDKSTRVGLKNSTQDELAVGRLSTNLILGNTSVNIDCSELLQMLTALEVYAKDCYDVTAQHKINVYNLTTPSEVKGYNHTLGYPDKLHF